MLLKEISECINTLNKVVNNKKFVNFDKAKNVKNHYIINRMKYEQSLVEKNKEKLNNLIIELAKDNPSYAEKLSSHVSMLNQNLEIGDYVESALVLGRMADVVALLTDKVDEDIVDLKRINFKIPNKIPLAIKDEILADLNEAKKCFENDCFRSCTIICGRVLEASLHRKYYEVTNNDILETNPGIGLGKLIAKLYDLNVRFGPGLNEQIHLINQVRIYSVHVKKESFNPSRQQTQAIILYTLDILDKLFGE